MDEREITRMAIEEIVRELEVNKLKQLEQMNERKVNPTGKPNKQFLGRTINSMLTHNKREDTRTRESCRRKLRELDRRRRYGPRSSASPYRVYDSESKSSDSRESSRKRQKKKRKRHKRERSRGRMTRSSRTPSPATYDCDDSARQADAYQESYQQQCYDSYNYLQSIAASTAMTMAYTQMHEHMMQAAQCSEAATSAPRGRSKSPSLSISMSSLSMGEEEQKKPMITIDVETDSEAESETEASPKKPMRCISVDSESSSGSSGSSSEEEEKENEKTMDEPEIVNLDDEEEEEEEKQYSEQELVIVNLDDDEEEEVAAVTLEGDDKDEEKIKGEPLVVNLDEDSVDKCPKNPLDTANLQNNRSANEGTIDLTDD